VGRTHQLRRENLAPKRESPQENAVPALHEEISAMREGRGRQRGPRMVISS